MGLSAAEKSSGQSEVCPDQGSEGPGIRSGSAWQRRLPEFFDSRGRSSPESAGTEERRKRQGNLR